MDAGQLAEMIVAGAVLFLGSRAVMGMLDRAESGFTSLFVPPDRTMAWPRGVQESDAPWGWRPAATPLETIDGEATTADAPREVLRISGASRYVLDPLRVAPIRFRALPQ